MQKIFGIKTERASHILKEIEKEIEADNARTSGPAAPGARSEAKPPKAPGHGRLSADDYRTAKKENMTPPERLRFHQEKSGPLMDTLKTWMEDQITGKKVEPNSSLGKAIQYMRKRWEKLTLFLRVPGVPLTNDRCERLLKTAIRHRNNSLFYKTESGAQVGDILMSLIQNAIESGGSPFHYLTALQKYQSAVAKNPERWFPWNYEETLKTLSPAKPAEPSP